MTIENTGNGKKLTTTPPQSSRVKLGQVKPGEVAKASLKRASDVLADPQDQHAVASPKGPRVLREPGKPTVTTKQKAVDWTPPQRAKLMAGIAGLTSVRAVALLQRLQAKDETLREPSVLEFAGANGTHERWLIGATARVGSFGKFRVAINLNDPDGEAMAVKEYRLEDRATKEAARTAPSASKVARALQMLKRIGQNRPHLQDKVDIFTRALGLADNAAVLAVYKRDIARFVDALGDLEEKDKNTLLLQPRTGHIKAADVAEENKLYPLAASPLEVKHSVELDERIYNFSGLMAGEAYDVAAANLGGQRRALSRMLSLEGLQSLATLHDQGILHRDIKPENLFLNRQGTAHLGDWGFAFLPTPQDPATKSLGSPQYVAPEVLVKKPYDAAADIYSMGHTIFCLSARTLLIDGFDPIKYKGQPALKQHLALDHIVRNLQFEADGSLDHVALIDLRTTLWNHPRIDPVLSRRLVDDMMRKIIDLHAADPQVCEFVLRHMLQFDPQDRASVHDLIKMFAALQPTDVATRDAGKALALQHIQAEMSVEDEIEILKVYGQVSLGS